jgi:hypothetical protein
MPSLFNGELEKIALIHEEKYSEFLSMHWRPLTSNDNYSIPDKRVPGKNCIIMQGPINTYKNFTFETIKLYNKIFPNIDIILSTWSDENINSLQEIGKLTVKIILSEKPHYQGIANINLHIISTSAGIKYAQEKKYDYILKTRTDCRIHAPDFFIHAFDLLGCYPLTAEIKNIQKDRLVSIGEGSKYALFQIPDKNMFGHISDMLKYWSPPLDSRETVPDNNLKFAAKFGVAESYFFKKYFSDMGLTIDYTLNWYWKIVADHFVVMDWHSADIYWCKYNRYREFKTTHYFGPSSFDSFGFKDWLRVYRNKVQLNDNEQIILRQHGAILSDLAGFN